MLQLQLIQMSNMINWIRESLSKAGSIPANSYTVSPQSTIQIQIQPKQPDTSSNLILTAFRSDRNSMLVPVKVKWFRSKYLNSFLLFQQKNISIEAEQIKENNTTTYQCSPSDLGYFLHARVDTIQGQIGFANVVIGPIRIDPMIKTEMQNFLAHDLFSASINFVEGQQKKQGKVNLSTKTLQINSIFTNENIFQQYTISKPSVEINKKKQNSILLGFEEENIQKAKKFIKSIFFRHSDLQVEDSILSELDSSMKNSSKIFRFHPIFLIQIEFQTRQMRDCFLIMRKAFLCKQSLKNSVIFEQIQQMQKNINEISISKFLEFMYLKEEIYRLYMVAKAIQLDRNKKIRDLTNLEESIGEITLTYLKIIEDIGNKQECDLNKSYSDIAIKREQIIQKKQVRLIKQENAALHNQLKQLQAQFQLLKKFKGQNYRDSTIKKLMDPQSLKKQFSEQIKHQRQNSPLGLKNKEASSLFFSMTTPIKERPEKFQENIQSNQLIKDLRDQILSLKTQIDVLRNSVPPRLQFDSSQSIISFNNSISNITGPVSEHSLNFQHSMTSQTQMRLLEQKFMNLVNLNQRLLEENNRIRKQRDHYKQLARSYRIRYKQLQQIQKNRTDALHNREGSDIKHLLQICQDKCQKLILVNRKLQSEICILKKKKEQPQINKDKQINELSAKIYLQKLGYEPIKKTEQDKIKKKLKDMTDEILMLRRNADALDRSRNLSQDMELYYEDELNTIRKQMELLKDDNQRLQVAKDKIDKQLKQYKNSIQKKGPTIAINDLLD